MTLLPSSLRGRYALLLVLLVVLGELTAAVLLRQLVLRPRMEQAADNVARTAAALRAGLMALPPAQRAAYVAAFNASGLREAERSTQEDAPVHRLGDRLLRARVQREYMRAISARLGAADGLLWRQHEGRLELRIPVEGVDHALVLPGLRIVREFSGAWLIATALSASLALVASLWLLGRLGRPLARVEEAARAVARGTAPPPLPEDGPREVATVSRSFNAMVRSLAEAERDRAVMLAGVSHDLRTPLTKLRLGVELGEARLDRDLLDRMRRSIDEMDAIVSQFLDFARDDALEPLSRVDLWSLAQQLAAINADYGREVLLEGVSLPETSVHVPSLLRALGNLVENAFRHGRPPVVLRSGSDADGVWLDVCDAGAGIPAGQVEALKQPFRRGDNARSGASGAGLGLAIVDRVVRRHGGEFSLRPGAGGGTCARVRLPRMRAAQDGDGGREGHGG